MVQNRLLSSSYLIPGDPPRTKGITIPTAKDIATTTAESITLTAVKDDATPAVEDVTAPTAEDMTTSVPQNRAIHLSTQPTFRPDLGDTTRILRMRHFG